MRDTKDQSPLSQGEFQATCRAMTATLNHRGPDDTGHFEDDRIALGNRRLSILDLSPKGHQPMTNEDQSLWLTYNGEIYNYRGLRRELIGRGHRFRSETDGEVIPHLFEEYGEAGFQRLEGMFAFGLWNQRQRTLFLVRDRLGMKPLFYRRIDGLFLFASEIKALRAGGRFPLEMDLQGLADTFTFSYTVAPRTCFKDVWSVRPGHYLKVTCTRTHEVEYWSPEFTIPGRAWVRSGTRRLARQLHGILLEAVERHLASHVPVSVALSGGLDSSVMAAAMVRLGHRPTAFSLTFDDPTLDESPYANLTVQSLGIEGLRFQCTADLGLLLEQAVWAMEQPLVFNFAVPQLLLARGIHERGYKVVLSGDGADELFAGYDVFKMTKIRPYFSLFPQKLRSRLLEAILGWMQLPQDATAFAVQCLARPCDTVVRDLGCYPAWYDLWGVMQALRTQVLTPDALAALERPTLRDSLEGLRLDRVRDHDPLTQSLYIELKTRLPFLLAIGDRVPMAYSVEARLPFLDRALIDFALGLPSWLKLHGLKEKYLLRKAAGGMLPAAIARRRKHPFHGPIREWFLEGRCWEYFRELLSFNQLHRTGLINARFVAEMIRYLREGPRRSFLAMQYEWAFLWVLSLQLLWKRFIEARD